MCWKVSFIKGGSAATTCLNFVVSTVMFARANCDSIHANQPLGLSLENCGGLIEVAKHEASSWYRESLSLSGIFADSCVDGESSLSCCRIRSFIGSSEFR